MRPILFIILCLSLICFSAKAQYQYYEYDIDTSAFLKKVADSSLNMGTNSITLGGVTRTTWPASGGSATNLSEWAMNPAVSNVVPVVSNLYDLGSIVFPWRDLYLSTNSIYMGGRKVLSFDPAITALVSAVKFMYREGGTNVDYATEAWVQSQGFSTNADIGSGRWFVSEDGNTSIVYHVTSGGHTNKLGSFYTSE